MKSASLLLFAVGLQGAVHFEPNRGQADSGFLFLARTDRGMAGIAPNSVELHDRSGARTSFRLEGASAQTPAGQQPLPGLSHYALHPDPSRWIWDVPRFAAVRFSNVYLGIDLLYHAKQGSLEFDFEISAGADPSAIRLRFAEPVRLASSGELTAGATTLRAPRAWQTFDGRRRAVAVRFTILGSGVAGFQLGGYDATQPMTIDPIVEFATYLGGEDNEWNTRLAAGADGAIFVAGATQSADFPAALPPGNVLNRPYILLAPDAYVARIKPDGTAMEWSLFIGGSGRETVHGLRRDHLGNLYLLGGTASPNFPVTAGAFRSRIHPALGDLFLVKLDAATGHILASTFLGVPQGMFPADEGVHLAVDPDGGAYVAGALQPGSFVTTPGVVKPAPDVRDAKPCFAMRMAPSLGALVYSTYLGFGSVQDIEVDRAGNLLIGGGQAGCAACGAPFPAVSPITGVNQTPLFAQAYVARLNATGTAVSFASLIHGDGRNSTISDLHLGNDGAVHLTGYSDGDRFPLRTPLDIGVPSTTPRPEDPMPFHAKLSAGGQTLVQATLFYGPEYNTAPMLSAPAPLRVTTLPDGTPCLFNLGSARFQQSAGALNGDEVAGGTVACLNNSQTGLGMKTQLPSLGISGYADAVVVTSDGDFVLAGSGANSLVATRGSLQTVFGGGVESMPHYGDAFLLRVSRTNPAPVVTGVVPGSILLDTRSIPVRTIDVAGSGFAFGAEVTWNGKPRQGRFVHSGLITLSDISDADLEAGQNRITVSIPGPGGGTSEGVVTGVHTTPSNVAVSPSNVAAGALDTTVTIRARGLVKDSILYWNGAPRQARFVADAGSRGGRFELVIPASELATPSAARVAVGNPPPGGGTSTHVVFSVSTAGGVPTPFLSSPAQPFHFGGSPPLGPRITLSGSGLLPTTKVFWDGVEVPVELLPGSRISIEPPAADMARWGTHSVYAANDGLHSPPVRVFVARQVALRFSAADPTRKRLYLLTRDSNPGGQRNSLVTLGMEHGDVINQIPGFMAAPVAMAISSDGRYLYFADRVDDSVAQATMRRYDTVTAAFDLAWTVPIGWVDNSPAITITPVPDAPDTIVTWNPSSGVAIFDGDRIRPNGSVRAGFKATDEPAFVTQSRIYLNGPSDACWQWMDFDADGITGGSPGCSAEEPPGVARDGGLVYLLDGERTFAVSLPDLLLPRSPPPLKKRIYDLARRRAYLANTWPFTNSVQLYEFDLKTQQPSAEIPLTASVLERSSFGLYPGVTGGVLVVTASSITLLH